MKYYAAIDLGTTNIKCAIFKEKDGELRLCDKLEQECELISTSTLEVEQNATIWWDITCKMLKTFSTCYDIAAVGISSQGITIVPVDENNKPLHNAISWLDQRKSVIRYAVIKRFGVKRYRAITSRLDPGDYGIARIMWLLIHRKKLSSMAYKYLMPMDFINAKLCGVAVTDHSMAAGTAAYDIKNKCWSDEILESFNVPSSKLPLIQNSGSIAGYVTEIASEQTGLKVGTVVAVGAQDQKCGALGAGLKKGIASLSMGTAFALTIKLNDFVQARDGFIPIFADILGEGYQWEACIATGGAALQWLGRLLNLSSEEMSDQIIDYIPDEHNPYFFPHMSGCYHPKMYPDACGNFYNLSMNNDKTAMIYAVMEGIVFSLNQNIILAKAANEQVSEIYAYGGGSRSDPWLQLLADVSGVVVHALMIEDASCVGAAMLAAKACGVDKVSHQNEFRRVFVPDLNKTNLMQMRFKRFNKVEKRIFTK